MGRHSRPLATAAALTALAAFGAAGQAVASDATPGFVHVTGANGQQAGWASVNYLEQHPHAIPGITVTPRNTSKTSVRPDSANGCAEDVCIDIEGSSTTVTKWETTAYGNVGCTQASYHWYPGGGTRVDSEDGPIVCPDGSGDGVYYDTTGPTGYFSDGTKLCNAWYNIDGYPCESIEE